MEDENFILRIFSAVLGVGIAAVILGLLIAGIKFIRGIGKISRHYYKHKDTGKIVIIEETWKGDIVASFVPEEFEIEPVKAALPHFELTNVKNAELESIRDKLVEVEAK
ncbi:MAG: hypothetical protein FVQ85_03470 [Planctomycetes bacterium]|nr:hypothetical protein [Planctomycetota bacterium]